MINVVFSNYYQEISSLIVDSIKSTLSKTDDLIANTIFTEVSGVWEIPYTINTSSPDIRYFIAVGAVVKGETDHYEYISNSVSNALMKITISNGVYISNCILNLHNIEQGVHRSTTKGLEAVEALLKVIDNDNSWYNKIKRTLVPPTVNNSW